MKTMVTASELKNNLPLTPLTLEQLLIDIVSELNSYSLDNSFLMNIYNNINNSTNITSSFNATEFENLFNAIKNNVPIKSVGNSMFINIVYATINEVASDDYKDIKLGFLYNGKFVSLLITKFSTAVYLDSKKIVTM